MTRKTYEVCNPHDGVIPNKTPDSSFKTCLCTMLVVLVIIILLFLMAFAFRNFLFSKDKDNISTDALRNQYRSTSTEMPNNTQIINDNLTQKSVNRDNQTTIIDEEQTTTNDLESLIVNKYSGAGEKLTTDTEFTETTTELEVTKHLTASTIQGDLKETQTPTEQNSEKIRSSTEHEATTVFNKMSTETKGTTIIDKPKNISPDDVITENDLGSTAQPQKENNKKCNSVVCITTAGRMLASMDLSQKPCENFFEYACGGISDTEESGINSFSHNILKQTDTPNFIKKFNTFYESCLEHEDRFHYRERVQKVRDLVHTVGSFQNRNEDDSQDSLTKFVADLILLQVMPFFDVEVDIDPGNDTYILKLLKPDRTSLDMDHWSSFSEEKRICMRETEERAMDKSPNITMLYTNMLHCQLNYSGFFDSIVTSMQELGFFSNLTEKKQEGRIFDIKYTIEWDVLMNIYSIMDISNVEEEIISKKYIKMSVEELEKEFPQIKWSKLFQLLSNTDGNNKMKVFLHDLNYFKKVFDVIENSSIENLNDALLALLASTLYQNTVLSIHRHSRVKYCREISQELMPDIANYIYQLNNYNEEIFNSTATVNDIFETLKTRFKDSLEEREWLDEDSKESIKKKVDHLNLVFNSSDLMYEKSILENAYNNLILEDGHYQANLFNLTKHSKMRLLSLYGQKVTPDNMYRNFVDINKNDPVFFYTSNIVCIPHGLIRKVLKVPRHITLAQVGFPLAKIIGYSFDSVGMKYDVQLDESAMQRFKEFSEESRDTITLSDPISFEDRKFNFKLNNALSQNERMAEKTAFRLLEDTFRSSDIDYRLPWISKNSTAMGTFLLAVTQEFCQKINLMEFTIQAMESSILPPQFRIENILSNSEGFLKEFNCKVGAGMTRMNSSSVFPYLKDATLEY